MAPVSKWSMPQAKGDEYVCYGFDTTMLDEDRHITAIYPKLDNTKIVHHLLLYQADKPMAGAPSPCSPTPPLGWKLYYAWGPGTQPQILPPEAGYRLEKGKTAHFVLQVHYSNLQHLDGETDATGIEMCTDKPRQYDADVMAFGSINFSIPAHATKTIDCGTPISSVPAPAPLTVFQMWPHMHLLGRKQSARVTHADGTSSTVFEGDYDFYTQLAYPAAFQLVKGDTVNVACTFDNMTDSTVNFGEQTSDEMCFNFFSYYPKATSSTWSWIGPAALSKCK